MYQGTHPVNWCPRDETAIADAEVDHVTREGTLHYIKYPLEGTNEYLLIATSRPEFIPACVAVEVNPNDERYSKYIGRKIGVPLMNRTVSIIGDECVDPKFGTGVVQICTYGDKDDVKTVIQHKLPVIRLINESGRVTEAGCKYSRALSEPSPRWHSRRPHSRWIIGEERKLCRKSVSATAVRLMSKSLSASSGS